MTALNEHLGRNAALELITGLAETERAELS